MKCKRKSGCCDHHCVDECYYEATEPASVYSVVSKPDRFFDTGSDVVIDLKHVVAIECHSDFVKLSFSGGNYAIVNDAWYDNTGNDPSGKVREMYNEILGRWKSLLTEAY